MNQSPENWIEKLVQHLFGTLTATIKKLNVQPFVFVVAVGLLLAIVLVVSIWGISKVGDLLVEIVLIIIAVIATLALIALAGYFIFELRLPFKGVRKGETRMSSDDLYSTLLKRLIDLTEPEFRVLVYTLLTKREQAMLIEPADRISRGDFLNDMKIKGRLLDIEKFLNREHQ